MADDGITVTAAKPFPFSAPRGRLGLLNIDWQRDFLEPGGFGDSLGNNTALLQAALGPTAALLAAARAAGMPVFHTLEAHKPDMSNLPPSKKKRCSAIGEVLSESRGKVLIEGEPGNAIVDEVAPIAGEIIINKPGKGAFWNTSFEDELQRLGVTHLLVTGVTTEVCVQTTIREANDRGYECLLVTDATESYFPQFKASTLEMIVAQGGIAGWTASTADIIPAIQAAGSAVPVESESDGSGVGTMKLDANGEQCVDLSGAGSVAAKLRSGPLERPAPLESVPASARAAADRLLASPLVAEANASARRVLAGVQPMLKAVVPAHQVVTAFAGGAKAILHAGPPVARFQDMCGPMRGAIIGAVLLEGWAEDAAAAADLAASGALTLQPCHQHSAVGPMSGILCPSMPVLVTVDASGSTTGAAYCSLNEGLGKVLRFGAHSDEVLARLRWMCVELGPALNAALAKLGGLKLRPLMAMALQMGDDGHNRWERTRLMPRPLHDLPAPRLMAGTRCYPTPRPWPARLPRPSPASLPHPLAPTRCIFWVPRPCQPFDNAVDTRPALLPSPQVQGAHGPPPPSSLSCTRGLRSRIHLRCRRRQQGGHLPVSERPLWSQRGHGHVQAGPGHDQRHPALLLRHRDGTQRHRARGHRRGRPRRLACGAVPGGHVGCLVPGLRPLQRRARPRRLSHHGDARPGRPGHRRRAGAHGLRRRQRRASAPVHG
jgi:nicotinamidase-related amidase